MGERSRVSDDIEELFKQATSLEGPERARFLADLKERDAGQAALLASLLSADAVDGGRVPENPAPTDAELAARVVVQEREAKAELDPASREVLERLASRVPGQSKYAIEGEIGRGGMGAVLEVWDEDLRRKLAMKVTLAEHNLPVGSGPQSLSIARFLEEAQVTGQLDHPGIVPVHELGVDESGRVFFTMRLVRGRPLDEIFGMVQRGEEGWNRTRALGVLLKVCEAMAYAHSKGVIHRDLKPANVMVGRFGEVYVMDWGVARVVGKESTPTQRRLDQSLSEVRTARRARAESSQEDSAITHDGSVLGTPFYMPPEQAGGEYEKVDARSDVYALGAMLYQLLTGEMPYHKTGQRPSPHTVLAMVLQGPPRPVGVQSPRTPPELVAICEKAMAREREDRYADMLALAEDLQAYLERRVVRAYATGPLVELKKWVVRNRAAAAAAILAMLLVVAGGAVSFLQAEKLRAEKEARDYRMFLKYAQLDESALRVDSSEMWPVTPDRIPAYDQWLAAVDEWLRGAEEVRGKLEELRGRGIRSSFSSPYASEVDWLLEKAGTAEVLPMYETGDIDVWSFEDPEERWIHDQTARLVRAIERFSDPDAGLIEGISIEHGWGIARRRAWAAQIEELTVSGEEARERWVKAVKGIAANPDYDGLVIEPQLGLIPLGADVDTGLWEFCLPQSGSVPKRDHDGFLALDDDTGLVFVLIPGGSFAMGAQAADRDGPNYDPQAEQDEGPVHDVTLSPYFLSKYEMNKAQWSRIAGEHPSLQDDIPWSPVSRIDWWDCVRVLGWLGCTLPTEAQWEYAVRAGTDTPWWPGADVAALQDCSNLADVSFRLLTILEDPHEEALNDGAPYMAPAYYYDANAFGLHGVIGNVWEWCLDQYGREPYEVDAVTDPFVPYAGGDIVARGGSYKNRARFARSANRSRFTPNFMGQRIGVRPARRIEGEVRYAR